MNHALAIELHIRFFKKEAQIVEVLYREVYPETLEDIGFTPIGLDEPYRIVVGNNPVNFVDPLGLQAIIVPDDPSKGCPPGRTCLNPGTYDPNKLGPMGGSNEFPYKLNPNGLVCTLVCNLGNGLVSTSLALSGVGSTITVPVWIAGRGFCSYICPSPIKPKCPEKK